MVGCGGGQPQGLPLRGMRIRPYSGRGRVLAISLKGEGRRVRNKGCPKRQNGAGKVLTLYQGEEIAGGGRVAVGQDALVEGIRHPQVAGGADGQVIGEIQGAGGRAAAAVGGIAGEVGLAGHAIGRSAVCFGGGRVVAQDAVVAFIRHPQAAGGVDNQITGESQGVRGGTAVAVGVAADEVRLAEHDDGQDLCF
jgi:hypothetical protein